MGYKNLKAEMARQNVLVNDIAKELKKSRTAVSNNLNGRGSFSVDESLAIRNRFFPDMSIDYLFAKDYSDEDSETEAEEG